MNKTLVPALIFGTLTLTGCAGHSKVIVDHQGIDINIYQKDLAECQKLADQVDSNIVGGIIGGAIIGTIVAVISAGDHEGHSNRHHNRHRSKHRSRHRSGHYSRHSNGPRVSTASAAKLGAVGGAVSGAVLASSGSVHKSNRVLKNCIADRGYRILN